MTQPPLQPNPAQASGVGRPGQPPIAVQQLALSQLLQLCLRHGDEASWAEFIRCAQPVIAGVVVKAMRRWRSPSPAMVDDLVQETYLKLCANDFKALREFVCEHDNALYGFLKVVATHAVHDHFRGSYSQKRGNGREDEELEQAGASRADSSTSVERMERGILLQEISQCLESRAAGPHFARDYAIFWLYYVQGYTAKAIARLPNIGLTIKGVESTLLRLTRLVREGLTGKPSADED